MRAHAENSEEAFLETPDELGGRFVIIVSDSGRVRIFPDACATKAVFYDLAGYSVLVSSHSALIADIRDYNKSDFSKWQIAQKAYQRHASYLPGVDSRATLAAAGPEQTLCFTYRFKGRPRELDDAAFAKKLCTRFGYRIA